MSTWVISDLKKKTHVFFWKCTTQPKSSPVNQSPTYPPPAEIAGLMIRAWIWGGGTSRGWLGDSAKFWRHDRYTQFQKTIGSMGREYFPTWIGDFYGKWKVSIPYPWIVCFLGKVFLSSLIRLHEELLEFGEISMSRAIERCAVKRKLDPWETREELRSRIPNSSWFGPPFYSYS